MNSSKANLLTAGSSRYVAALISVGLALEKGIHNVYMNDRRITHL